MFGRVCSLIKMSKPLRNRGFLDASGTVVPADATDGYQTGCTFKHTDGGDNTALYVNEGSVTSSAFRAIEGAGVNGHDPIVLASSTVTGIDLTGTYSGNAIDFSDATIVPAGSNGPCLIRAGTYASPIDYGASNNQSGMIRIYSTCSGDISSYDRGIFTYCETTGAKAVYPLASLAEANNTGTGPKVLGAAQLIAHLGAQSSGATLTTLGGTANLLCGMYAAQLKVAASGTAVCDSGSRIACAWIDNQMSGTVTGEEFGIFATTGASRPDAFIGFSTNSSGYSQFLSFDSTFNSGAGTCVTTDSVPGTQDARIKVYYNGAQYYLPLYR